MKKLLFKRWYVGIIASILLCMTVLGIAEANASVVDNASGKEVDGNLEVFYQEYFDNMCSMYSDQLSDGEKYCSYAVYDAIATTSFDSEKSLKCRERITGIATADDLHGILTGFFDANDASYYSDEKISDRLEQILTVCHLRMNDYYFSVIRNVPGLPEPITKTNWFCRFTKKDMFSPESGDDIIIVLFDDDMKVGSFVMNMGIVGN